MKPIRILATAVAFALPAWTLCAQDNPAPRPPDAPQRDGGPRREAGPRPEGLRPMAGLFAALDANHDGVIDAEEINHATEALRKLDRNGDGKLGPDDLHVGDGSQRRPEGGDGRRPQGDNARPGGERQARPDGERRGPDLRAEGRGEQRPEAQPPRGEDQRGPRPEGREPRGPRPEAGNEQRPQGERPRREAPPQDGPQAEARREGPGAPSPNAAGPQAEYRPHRHHHRFGGPDQGGRFAQRGAFRGGPNSGPNFGPRFAQREPQPWGGDRPGPRPSWDGWKQRFEHGPHNRFALAHRFGGFGPGAAPQGPQQGEFRRDAQAPNPQAGPQGHRPPQGGPDQRFGAPNFQDQRGGPQPGGPQFGGQQPNGPQPGGPQFGPGPRGFDRGDMHQRSPWQGSRRGFGPPPEMQNRQQSPEHSPMPPAPQGGPNGPRFQPGPHDGPPRGAEAERQDEATPV